MIAAPMDCGPSPTANAVRQAAARAAFGRRLIVNHLRGLIAETIVAAALKPEWRHCSHDYAGWDFERADGRLLEVKQSAARQSWAQTATGPGKATFDIRPRQGRYDGATWHASERPQRWADVYVFAYHEVVDITADHCEADQWAFYVVPTPMLPAQKTLSLAKLRQLTRPVSFLHLREAVEQAVGSS